jgi:hypothetical protein
MSEKCWYYGSEGERTGPFTKQQVEDLVEEGVLTLESEVYSEVLGQWIQVVNIDEPGPMIREHDLEDIVHEGEETRARPWVRFFARGIDYIFFSLFLGIVSGLLRVPYFNTSPLIGFLFMIFIWSFVEAGFLMSWGTTPGKAILGVWVRKTNGHKLTYGEGLSRAFSVWLLGMGAGLPLVMIVTWIVACVKLSNNKVTSWDRRGRIVVHHKNVNWLRILITVIIYVAYGALINLYGRPR